MRATLALGAPNVVLKPFQFGPYGFVRGIAKLGDVLANCREPCNESMTCHFGKKMEGHAVQTVAPNSMGNDLPRPMQ
jgi:hypothetical protein